MIPVFADPKTDFGFKRIFVAVERKGLSFRCSTISSSSKASAASWTISVDARARSRALAEQLGLSFTLLCDPARQVVEADGLLNRKEKGGVAYPATLVLDRDRTVRFRSLDRTAARVELGELFAFLREGPGAIAPASPARAGIIPRLGDLGRILRNALRFGVRSPRA